MKIATDFLTGKPTAKTWSGVHGYRPESGIKVEVFGEMFGVMSIGSEINFDFANLGGLLFDELQEAYFQDYKTETNFLDFKKAVYRLRERLDEILSREEELAGSGIDLEMVVAIVKADVLFVAVVGESHVYIQRGDECADISQSLADPDHEGFVRSGSMLLAEGDKIMLTTSNAKELEVEERFKTILSNFAYGRDKLFTGASILLGYGVEPPQKIEPEPEIAAITAEDEQLSESEVDKAEELIKAYEDDIPEPLIDMEPGSMEDLSEDDDPLAEPEAPRTEAKHEPDFDALEQEIEAEVESAHKDEAFENRRVDKEDQIDFLDEPTAEIIEEKREPGFNEYPPRRFEAEVAGAVAAPATQSMILDNIKKYAMLGKEQAIKLAGNAKSKATEMMEKRKSANMSAPEVTDFDNDEPHSYAASFDEEAEIHSGVVGGSGSKVMDGLNKLKNTVIKGAKPIAAKASQFINKRSGGRAEMYLRRRGPSKNWKVLILVGVVIAVGLFFGLQRLSEEREREAHVLAVETEVSSITERMEALDLEVATVTISKGKESERSKLINKLDQLISDAKGLTSEQIRADELELVVTQASKAKDQLQNIRAITDPLIISDLGVNFENAKLSDIAFTNGKIFAVDEGRGTIYRLNTTSNSEPGVFVSDLERPYILDTDQNGDLVFVDRSSDSVVGTVNKESGEVTRSPGLSSTQMGDVVDFDVWTNAAMYSINKQKQSIVKQDNFGAGYQLPNDSAPWRSNQDLSRAVDIEVDYWVYVMHTGQGLFRYLAGEPDEFELTGILSEDKAKLKQATAFDITDTHLYIADPANRRILVFIKRVDDNKVMEFVEQYVYRGDGNVFSDIKEVVANPEANQLFVLDGSRIVRIDL